MSRLQKCVLNLISTKKNCRKGQKKSPEGPKKVQKRPKMWPNIKQKVRAVPPKPKLIVYIGRSQKSFRTGPQPEKKRFHFSILNLQIPYFQIANFKIPKFQISLSNFKFPFKILILGFNFQLRIFKF